MRKTSLKLVIYLLAVLFLAPLMSGCGVVGTAVGLTYTAAKTTVKAAGGAAKWTYRGTRNVYRKVTSSDEDQADYDDSEYADDSASPDHTASTKAIRLPEIVERP